LNRETAVSLLLLEDKHYVFINNLSKLFSSQTSKHNHKIFSFDMSE